jgi:regulator of sigma E protease
MTIILAVLAFLVAIGPLIVFHELGHYVVARMCNVKVLRFSVGFGKIIWSRRFGPDQTEWAISAIPLGGYVKMLDDRNPETQSSKADEGREYTRQSVWRRIAISAAGPLANFLVAIVVFSGLYMHGIPDASTRVRQGAETSAAYQAGLRQGDRIVAVNDVPVVSWGDLHLELLRAALDAEEVRLNVEQPRGGQFSTVLPAESLKGVKLEGDILGAIGLNTEFPPPVIESLLDGGVAQRAGIRVGDLVTAVGGQPVKDGLDVVKAVRSSAGKALQIDALRNGQPVKFTVTPQIDAASKQPRIGAGFPFQTEKVTVPAGPISAVAKGAQATWDHTIMQFRLIGRIVTMQMSPKNITGMITMGDYAEQTARAGIIPFLRFIALISISLGVMNLLPIPVLDGGNLLYYSLEVLTGRPLPERAIEFGQRLGVVLLMMLMVLAFYNDIDRLLKIT